MTSASKPFFDSNVVLYLVSDVTKKAARARALCKAGGTVSVQVLNETASVLRSKYEWSISNVRSLLRLIEETCEVTPPDISTHDLALEVAERFRFSIYDSCIIAAAMRSDCKILYSEDMQHGQRIGPLTIRNPFAL